MACDIIYSPCFNRDIRSAVEYFRNDLHSPASALRLTRGVRKAAKTLSAFPEIGAISSKPGLLEAEYREYLVGSHVIVYRTEGEQVILLRLFHQKQFISRELLEED